jgi:hypothetical protein
MFLARHIKELVHILTKLHRIDLPNFGTISVLFSYLIQASAITPDIRITGLTSTLAILCFSQISERFGMFFLQELDLQTGELPEILDTDDNTLLQILRVKRRVRHPLRNIANLELDDEDESITWQELTSYVNAYPDQFLNMLAWSDEDVVNEHAISMFEQFTREYWMALSTEYVDQRQLPQIGSILDAIQWWSVESFRTQMKHEVEFMACNAGLTGAIVGRRHPSFEERRKVFFSGPEVEHPRTSLWNSFKASEAYLDVYHRFLQDEPEVVVTEAQEALDTIFSKLQCLPFMANKNTLWS